LTTEDIRAGSYVLRIGVLNPAIRAVRDYWSVRLLGLDAVFAPEGANATAAQSSAETDSTEAAFDPAAGPNTNGAASGSADSNGNASLSDAIVGTGGDWRTAEPMLRIEVRGYGISEAFAGYKIAAIPVAASSWSLDSKLAWVAAAACSLWVARRC